MGTIAGKQAETPKAKKAARYCGPTVYKYARLDSNQRPLASENTRAKTSKPFPFNESSLLFTCRDLGLSWVNLIVWIVVGTIWGTNSKGLKTLLNSSPLCDPAGGLVWLHPFRREAHDFVS